ncbi:MAG: hypothetical protein ACE145_20900 [Terriglobia bacterium]
MPCRKEGREQVHHHFLEPEIEGGDPIPVCRWHFKGLPHPSTRPEAREISVSAFLRGEELKLARFFPQLTQSMSEEHTKMRRAIAIDEDRLRALHAQGMHDKEIGKALGISSATVLTHLHRLGLEANRKRSRENGAAHRAAHLHDASPPPNGSGQTVPIRVEILDTIWNGLEPTEKAGLINLLAEKHAHA